MSVLLAAVAQPDASAGAAPRLVVSGAGVRSVDVTFAKRTVLDFDNFVGDHTALTASYPGDFAGVAVLGGRDRRVVLGGAVLVRDRVARIDGGYPSPAILTEGIEPRLVLAPGRYRIVLLTDRAATVRVRVVQGLARDLRLTASHPERGISARRYALSDLVPGPVAAGITRVRFTIAERGLAVGAFYSSPGLSGPTYAELCVRRPAEVAITCDEGATFWARGDLTTTLTGRVVGTSKIPGEYSFDYTELIPGVTTRDGNAFVVSFTHGV